MPLMGLLTPSTETRNHDVFLGAKTEKVEWRKRGVNLSFRVRGLEGVEEAVTLKLYTDFRHFRLYCDRNDEALAKRVLEAVAEVA